MAEGAEAAEGLLLAAVAAAVAGGSSSTAGSCGRRLSSTGVGAIARSGVDSGRSCKALVVGGWF